MSKRVIKIRNKTYKAQKSKIVDGCKSCAFYGRWHMCRKAEELSELDCLEYIWKDRSDG